MSWKLKRAVLKVFCLFLPLVAWVLVLRPVLALDLPRPKGFVNDFAQILSADFINQLEEELANFEKETGVEIAVVTVDNLGGTTIEEFSVRLFEAWGIGKKGKDNGLLILIAPQEKKVRIEVGYGLEPIITDSRAGRIIRKKIVPAFKKGDYQEGIRTGVKEVEAYLRKGEPEREREKRERIRAKIEFIIISLVVLIYLSSFWGRSKRIWPGGVVGVIVGLMVGFLLGDFIWQVVLPLIFGLLGLFLDWILSANYQARKKAGKPTDFFSSWGGFSSGRSGFGGFGGGSSGGGGASGSW